MKVVLLTFILVIMATHTATAEPTLNNKRESGGWATLNSTISTIATITSAPYSPDSRTVVDVNYTYYMGTTDNCNWVYMGITTSPTGTDTISQYYFENLPLRAHYGAGSLSRTFITGSVGVTQTFYLRGYVTDAGCSGLVNIYVGGNDVNNNQSGAIRSTFWPKNNVAQP